MAPNLFSPSRSSSSPTSRPRGLPGPPAIRNRQPAAAAATSPPFSKLPEVAAAAVPCHGHLPRPSSRRVLVPAVSSNFQFKDSRSRFNAENSFHYGSSGSLHHGSAQHDHEALSTISLSKMVHQFFEEEEKETEELAYAAWSNPENSACGRARCNCSKGVCGDEFCAVMERDGEDDEASIWAQIEILQGYTNCRNKDEKKVQKDVEKAMEELILASSTVDGNVHELRRCVMSRLRDIGYNAAACKSRWNHGNGLPAGSYEYIDVLLEGSSSNHSGISHQDGGPALGGCAGRRIIVDIDFQSQFEIARQSGEYQKLLGAVPKVFVGKAEGVKQVVRMMSQAAKRSLRAHGLLVAPWHKHKYMEAKWLSPVYRRTTNTLPTSKKRAAQEEKRRRRPFHKLQLLYGEAPGSPSSNLRYLPQLAVCKIREVCTAMSTSWQPPAVECRSFNIRVSALSSAIKNAKYTAFDMRPSALSVGIQNRG